MDVDQIKRFLSPGSDNLIVTRAGARALKLKNEPYFKALPVWKYAADPDYQEALLRRIMRSIFDHKHKISGNNSDHPVQMQQTDIIDSAPIKVQEFVNQEHEIANENIVPFPKNARCGGKR